MIADELCLEIRKRYGSKRDIQIEVSEDNENGWSSILSRTIKMTIYIVDIEAVDTRYTKQWKEHLPTQLKRATNIDVKVISGGEVPQATTPGAFLNFGGTNIYKSKQLEQIGEMSRAGTIKDGDYFQFYTDAWNPTVIQLKYMAEPGVNIRIGGLWHAGSYDPKILR